MYAPSESAREREVLLRHLEIKDSEIRISMLRQGMEAVDRGIHAGGAMSAVLPLVALYYGGFMRIDVKHPTETQDLFVLSKGHAVAAMASIYADLGYFDRKHLNRSRSRESILNGHPGPLLPGVHVPTGPMGQGICVAGGFALAGRGTGGFDVFTLTGDGELQEGSVWEAVMYSGAVGLDNLCVIVDRNHGQLDNPCDTVFPMREPGPQFSAFGYRVVEVTAGDYGPMVEALREFRNRVRDGRPTAIIVNGRKGDGAFGSDFIKHKLTLNRSAVETELLLQERRLQKRRAALGDCLTGLRDVEPEVSPSPVHGIVCRKAPERDKRIRFDDSALPRIEPGERYQACDVVAKVMKAAAVDPRLVAIDSDLGSTSGLYGGISAVDRTRAMNVGIAEANMMCIGEAYASLGYNAWVSTFCPFFN